MLYDMIGLKGMAISAVIGMAIGGAATLGITKAVKPEVKVSCPKCPDLKCPEEKPCNGIDFDKIKSRNVTIENTQHITTSGDSLLIPKIRKVVREEMEAAKLVKCRK
jgi:hypothetical protein